MKYGVARGLGVVADAGAAGVVALSRLGLDTPPGLFDQPSLNAFMAAGPAVWAAVAEQLGGVDPAEFERALVQEPELVLPFEVADYVDFYASIHHALRVGRRFRPDNPLMPNYRHLPVGYHGRAGTVVVSGTPVRRPCGQRGAGDFGPSARLDYELEVGFVVGVGSSLGEPVGVAAAASHVFGAVLLNDWSARDIQAWEYQPLGPFLGKSFATSVSAWVTPLADLLGARVPGPVQDPEPLPYLRADRPWAFDIGASVEVDGRVLGSANLTDLYWTLPQLVAHLTANGASLRTGDLLGTGTVSGPEPGQEGCLLETGADRFLEDGSEVVLRSAGDVLAEVRGVVLPAVSPGSVAGSGSAAGGRPGSG
jgi:fumarylacetoacetase